MSLNECQNYKAGPVKIRGKIYSITKLGEDRNSIVISYKKDGAVRKQEVICSDFAAANLECGDRIETIGFWDYRDGAMHTRSILFDKRRGNNGR